MPPFESLTEEQKRELAAYLEQQKMGGGISVPPTDTIPAPSQSPLDEIIERKKRPDPLAQYDQDIQRATDRTPNVGQYIGAGFAGLGQAITGGKQQFLDKTLEGFDAARNQGIESAKLAKVQFEERGERDPESDISREFQITAAEMTGRNPEDLAGLSAYDIKKILPTLRDRYQRETRAEDKAANNRYREEMLKATREKTASTERMAEAKANAIDPFMKREISKAKVGLADVRGVVDSAIGEIDRVQELNKNSYGGKWGQAQMAMRSGTNLGTENEKFKNTADILNTMQSQVAKVLKSTFGAQLSDGEREYLNGIYGALPNLSQVERDIAMTNVKAMLQAKVDGAQSKVDELLSEVGITNVAGEGPATPTPPAGDPPAGNPPPNGAMKVKQNGKIFVWNGTKYVKEQ